MTLDKNLNSIQKNFICKYYFTSWRFRNKRNWPSFPQQRTRFRLRTTGDVCVRTVVRSNMSHMIGWTIWFHSILSRDLPRKTSNVETSPRRIKRFAFYTKKRTVVFLYKSCNHCRNKLREDISNLLTMLYHWQRQYHSLK